MVDNGKNYRFMTSRYQKKAMKLKLLMTEKKYTDVMTEKVVFLFNTKTIIYSDKGN